MSRRQVAAALLGCLLLTGCGPIADSAVPRPSTTVSDLGTVVVTGEPGRKPEVTVPTPFSVSTTQRLVLRKGSGLAVQAGQRVTIHYVGVNGVDGHEFVTDYGKHASSFVLSPASNLKGIVDGLRGTPIGSRLLLAIPPQDAYGLTGRPQAGIGPTDTLLIVIDLLDGKNVLTRATGSAVPPRPGLPTVTLDAAGRPIVKLPAGSPGPALVVQPLIVGTGPKVAKGDQITVEYSGVIWPGGRQFDSSWGAPTPASFAVGEGRLIAGWDEGLVGQAVGSQLLLVVPPDKGYGAAGQPSAGIKGTDTLVFVVDILDRVSPDS